MILRRGVPGPRRRRPGSAWPAVGGPAAGKAAIGHVAATAAPLHHSMPSAASSTLISRRAPAVPGPAAISEVHGQLSQPSGASSTLRCRWGPSPGKPAVASQTSSQKAAETPSSCSTATSVRTRLFRRHPPIQPADRDALHNPGGAVASPAAATCCGRRRPVAIVDTSKTCVNKSS